MKDQVLSRLLRQQAYRTTWPRAKALEYIEHKLPRRNRARNRRRPAGSSLVSF